jgi:hypothetical protein
MKTDVSAIYPGTPLLSGDDAATKNRAALQKRWLARMEREYESTDGNPSRLLYDWLEKNGADEEEMERCGLLLLDEDRNLKGSDRIASGPAWFDHSRILRRKKDGQLSILSEPYQLWGDGLPQLAELAQFGLRVWISGDSGWNPGRTLLVIVTEKDD